MDTIDSQNVVSGAKGAPLGVVSDKNQPDGVKPERVVKRGKKRANVWEGAFAGESPLPGGVLGFASDDLIKIMKAMADRPMLEWSGGEVLSVAQQSVVAAMVAEKLGCSDRIALLALLSNLDQIGEPKTLDARWEGWSWTGIMQVKTNFDLVIQSVEEGQLCKGVCALADAVCREAVKLDRGGDIDLADVVLDDVALVVSNPFLQRSHLAALNAVVGCRPMDAWYVAIEFVVLWRHLLRRLTGKSEVGSTVHPADRSFRDYQDWESQLSYVFGRFGDDSKQLRINVTPLVGKVARERDAAKAELAAMKEEKDGWVAKYQILQKEVDGLYGAMRWQWCTGEGGIMPDRGDYVLLEVADSVPGAKYQVAKWSPQDRAFWSFSGRYVQPREVNGWLYVLPPAGANGDNGGEVVKAV